ncbi:hypothetical protein P879_07582, partial [Paragonimus westermani]
MAKKRVELALQEEIETQGEWENVLQREGLIVVDVYQEWCGPCKAVVGLFRRIKTELNDDVLNFAAAKADGVESLDKYRGKCEPCFLFFGSGHLVAVVRGANPPVLEKTILEKLKKEHEILRGEDERVEIKDPVLLAKELAEADERRRKEEEEEVPQEVAVTVLKPDILESGRVDEIINDLTEKGIEIIERKEHTFTKDEAENFYDKLKDEPYFQKLVEFMTSGPSEVLLCVKGAEGVVKELNELLGSKVSGIDAENSCLRAKYASDTMRNAIHVADSKEEAARELAFFYPEFQPPTVRVSRPRLVVELAEDVSGIETQTPSGPFLADIPTGIQRTVALLRPKACALYKNEILQRIAEAGFTVALQKEVQLTKEQAKQYYSEHRDEKHFDELTTVMSEGPVLALLLARQGAVGIWHNMLGPWDVHEAKATAPDSLRARFAPPEPDPGNGEDSHSSINLLHGSTTEAEVEKDVQFFFPIERTVAAIKPDAYANRDEIVERIKSAGFHVAARRDIQLSKDLARQIYSNLKDKPFYEDLVHHLTSGRTLFMVLTRQDAVAGWRKLMGPTDPDRAADEHPDSIRAVYGKNVLENAVHGSTNTQHALESIKLIFGEEDVGLPEKTEAEAAKEGEHVGMSEKENTVEPAVQQLVEQNKSSEEASQETKKGDEPSPHEGATPDSNQPAEEP